jgi:outer membrane protein assembly factor BamB
VDRETGRELWKADLDESFQDEWGAGPRSTPFVDGTTIYAQSCRGQFRAFDRKDGAALWTVNFEKDFGVAFLGSKAREGTARRRGNNGSGLCDADRVFVMVGQTNNGSIFALDKKSGKKLWSSGQDEAAYSSLVLASPGGVRQLLGFTAESLSSFDPESGKILWRVPLKTGAKRHAATPMVVGDKILVTSQTIGLVCFQVKKDGSELLVQKAWENLDLKINLATVVVVGGHIFSQGPSKDFICADLATGNTLWRNPGGGQEYSAMIVIGRKILALTDDGRLLAIEASPEKFSKLAEWQVCGKNWNHHALSDGHLLIRDQRNLQNFSFR